MEANPTPVQLSTGPTPLERAPRLSEAIGLGPDDLWIKRDDLIGLGGGGNKVRKLQWSCAEALASGAQTLITSGAPQSNHARLTAAAGARLGLDVVLVLAGERPDPGPLAGNLALDALFGASIVWTADDDRAALEARMDEVAAELEKAGRRPAVIAYGGSTPLTTNAYLDVADEIRSQGVDPDHVVVAVGSGGTMAGLVRGFDAQRVLGVHCGAVTDPHRAVLALFPAHDPAPASLRIRMDQVGAGYSRVTPDVVGRAVVGCPHGGHRLRPGLHRARTRRAHRRGRRRAHRQWIDGGPDAHRWIARPLRQRRVPGTDWATPTDPGA